MLGTSLGTAEDIDLNEADSNSCPHGTVDLTKCTV